MQTDRASAGAVHFQCRRTMKCVCYYSSKDAPIVDNTSRLSGYATYYEVYWANKFSAMYCCVVINQFTPARSIDNAK